MRVRAAGLEDAVDITEIERRATESPWSLSQFLSSCRSEQQQVLVLESATGKLLGFAVSQQVMDEVSLLNLGVLPKHQGYGHGARLLQEVLTMAQEQGGRRCLLEVRAGNEKALGLYDRYGFTVDGVRKNYYPAGSGYEDALLMSRDLMELA